MTFTAELEIKALPPYDFETSCEIFGNGDKQIRNYENGKFWQVLAVNDKLILATVISQGNVNKPRITVELKSENEITEKDNDCFRVTGFTPGPSSSLQSVFCRSHPGHTVS